MKKQLALIFALTTLPFVAYGMGDQLAQVEAAEAPVAGVAARAQGAVRDPRSLVVGDGAEAVHRATSPFAVQGFDGQAAPAEALAAAREALVTALAAALAAAREAPATETVQAAALAQAVRAAQAVLAAPATVQAAAQLGCLRRACDGVRTATEALVDTAKAVTGATCGAARTATKRVAGATWGATKTIADTAKAAAGTVLNAVCATPRSVWEVTRSAARSTRSLAKRTVQAMLSMAWADKPEYSDYKYPQRYEGEYDSQYVTEMTKSMRKQAEEIQAARMFQIKRSITSTALATAGAAGVAYLNHASNMPALTIGTAAVTGLASWFYNGHRAGLGELARRYTDRVDTAINYRHINPREAAIAAQLARSGIEEITEDAVTKYATKDNGFFNGLFTGLRRNGLFGTRTISRMQRDITAEYSRHTDTVSRGSEELVDLH